MLLDLDKRTQEFIRDHRVARLATSDVVGQPAVVPICYAFDGERLYVPLDEKPKSVPDHELKRVRNIRANPRVAVVVDDYSEDWSDLVYVLIRGTAEVISSSENADEHRRAVELLRGKYPQYRSMKLDERSIIKITPIRIKRWAAADKGEKGEQR